MTKESLEQARSLAGLLKAYGDVREQPTDSEMKMGCKDGARAIESLLAEVERLMERDRAWSMRWGGLALTAFDRDAARDVGVAMNRLVKSYPLEAKQ